MRNIVRVWRLRKNAADLERYAASLAGSTREDVFRAAAGLREQANSLDTK